jgi:H+-transporting ATPase
MPFWMWFSVRSIGAFAVVATIAEASPPAAAMVQELQAKGFRVLVLAVGSAQPLRIAGPLCSTAPLPRDIRADDFAVFAGVMPEDKYALVQALQRAGHIAVVFGAAIVLAFCLDTVKVFLFRRLAIA